MGVPAASRAVLRNRLGSGVRTPDSRGVFAISHNHHIVIRPFRSSPRSSLRFDIRNHSLSFFFFFSSFSNPGRHEKNLSLTGAIHSTFNIHLHHATTRALFVCSMPSPPKLSVHDSFLLSDRNSTPFNRRDLFFSWHSRMSSSLRSLDSHRPHRDRPLWVILASFAPYPRRFTLLAISLTGTSLRGTPPSNPNYIERGRSCVIPATAVCRGSNQCCGLRRDQRAYASHATNMNLPDDRASRRSHVAPRRKHARSVCWKPCIAVRVLERDFLGPLEVSPARCSTGSTL